MATYLELFSLGQQADNNDLWNKVTTAVMIKAEALLSAATPTTDEVAWAANAVADPRSMAKKILYTVLAANADLSVAQIIRGPR